MEIVYAGFEGLRTFLYVFFERFLSLPALRVMGKCTNRQHFLLRRIVVIVFMVPR